MPKATPEFIEKVKKTHTADELIEKYVHVCMALTIAADEVAELAKIDAREIQNRWLAKADQMEMVMEIPTGGMVH